MTVGQRVTAHGLWCIAKNGGVYTQTGVATGLKVPCLFMIAEVSIRCQKNPEVGICRIPAYTPPVHHWSRVKWANKSEWVTWVTGQYLTHDQVNKIPRTGYFVAVMMFDFESTST